MPSLALGTGAGAAEGLETLLARHRAEEVLRQAQERIAEDQRSNRATEDYRNRALTETAAQRQATSAASIANMQEQRRQGEQAQTRALLPLRPIGAEVSPETMQHEISAGGADSSFYNVTPGRQVQSTIGFLPIDRGAGGATSTTPDQASPLNEPSHITFRGTQPNIEAAAKEAGQLVGNEVKTVLLNGKPVDANYNPKTQKYTYQGQDVTNQIGHYEKPPAPPQSVVVQTGEGPQLVNRGNATARPITSAGGKVVTAPLPAQTRQQMQNALKVSTHIDPIKNLIDEADQRGWLGPVFGRFSDFMANGVGSTGDPEKDYLLGELYFGLKGLTSGFAMVHGGARGGGSPDLLRQWQSIINSKTMSRSRLEGAIDEEKRWLDTYATNPNDLAPNAPAAPATAPSGGTSGFKVIGTAP